MKNIFAIVVLYKVDFFRSTVYRQLLSQYIENRTISYLVYDNSPIAMHKEDEFQPFGGWYIHDPNNSGVSAAYNVGANIAETIEGMDYLLLLDQDTLFEYDYIEKLKTAISLNRKCNLFIPYITYKKGSPFSPIKKAIKGSHGVKLEVGEYDLTRYSPVNSGACVKLSAFKMVGGYNEMIKLDFADFDFFSRLSFFSPNFNIINSHAVQSFSNEESDENKLLHRFELYINGAKYAMGNTLIRKYVIIDTLKHTLALSIRNMSLNFIYCLIRNL